MLQVSRLTVLLHKYVVPSNSNSKIPESLKKIELPFLLGSSKEKLAAENLLADPPSAFKPVSAPISGGNGGDPAGQSAQILRGLTTNSGSADSADSAGPTGSVGPTGSAGSNGSADSAGPNGSAGSTGPTGSAGSGGPNGPTGSAGTSSIFYSSATSSGGSLVA